MPTKLYLVVLLDKDVGPYVWTDTSELGYAYHAASEAMRETGFKAIVKTIEINEGE